MLQPFFRCMQVFSYTQKSVKETKQHRCVQSIENNSIMVVKTSDYPIQHLDLTLSWTFGGRMKIETISDLYSFYTRVQAYISL